MVKRLDVTNMKLMVKTMILLFAENISQTTDHRFSKWDSMQEAIFAIFTFSQFA